MLTCFFLSLNPYLQRVQGLFIATHIEKAAADMRRDRESKALARQTDAEKGVTDLLGSNLAYLLRLSQVADHKDLPTMWKELAGSQNHQHMASIQRDLNDTALNLSFRAPIFATSGLLKLNLSLGFRLEHHNNLGLGLHHFGLGQHSSSTRKVLKAWADQH